MKDKEMHKTIASSTCDDSMTKSQGSFGGK